MKVKKLIFNWHQTGSVEHEHGLGDDYSFYEVGKGGVKSIVEHTINNVFSYTILVEENGELKTYRQFNPNSVEYLN